MTSEEYVAALYRLALGREPDSVGLANWLDFMASSGDPVQILGGLLDSEEYRAKHQVQDPADLILEALPALTRAPRIVDVGAQSLTFEEHIYAPLARVTPVEVIGFEPLENRVQERLLERDGSRLTLLPFAIGDGREHTLYINNDDATSSLYPLNLEHNACFNHISELRTVEERKVQTRRLDDVLPPGPIDFLKLDVQGAELDVLLGASASLEDTAVVHCEVEFSPIYKEQPLYPEIHSHLAASGFALIDLRIPVRYSYLSSAEASGQDRLLWADAIFFRESNRREILLMQALIAAVIYRKRSLAAHLLERARAA